MDFFQTVFRHAPSTGAVRWGPIQPVVFITLEELFGGVAAISSTTDQYFSPAVRAEGDATKAGVLGASVAWLDYDGEGIPVSLLPPSIKVASGGPGRFHFYWLLSKFIDSTQLEAVNKTISAHHKDSGGTWDCTRILRVPGSSNTKYTPPRPVRIVETQLDRVYDPADLQKLQPYEASILQVPQGKSRSERDWRIAQLMLSWGLSTTVVETALSGLSEKAKEEGNRYTQRTVKLAAQTPAAQAHAQAPQKLKPPKLLANFYVTPTGALVGPQGEDEGLVLQIHWEEGDQQLRATQKDFESRRALNTMLARNSLRSRAWVGSDGDATNLWMALVEYCPAKEMLLVHQAGRHDLSTGQRVFVYGRGATECEALFYPPGTDIPVYWEPQAEATLKTQLVEGPLDKASKLLQRTLSCNRQDVMQPGLGWVLAAPLKPLIEAAGVRFPILLVFGQKGSGKTTLVRDILLPLVGVRGAPLGADATRFALIAALSAFNALPLWLGEFRASLNNLDDLQAHLRMSYDGAKAERGRPDLTVSSYHLTSPVVVDGESLFPDTALRERALPLRLVQKDVVPGECYSTELAKLTQLADVQPAFARAYLEWALTVDEEQVRVWIRNGVDIFTQLVPFSRLANTAAVAWLGLQALEAFAAEKAIEFTWDYDTAAIYETLLNTFTPGLGVATPVESLVEIMAHAFKQGQSWAEGCCKWDAEEGILWVNMTTSVHWVRRFCREIPERDMLLPQAEERVGIYLHPQKSIEGGLYYGVNIAAAQSLGLDVPTPEVAKFEFTMD